MKRIFIWLAAILMVIVIACIAFALIKTRDRHPGYEVDLRLPLKAAKSGQLKVGFAAEIITPELPDQWTDVDKMPGLNLIRGILILTKTGMANLMPTGLQVLITGALPVESTMIYGPGRLCGMTVAL